MMEKEESKKENKKDKKKENKEQENINLTEYILRNNKTFKEDEFNILDAAVFAKIVYLNLKGKVSTIEEEKQEDISIRDIYILENMDNIFDGIYLVDLMKASYNAVILSKRFRDVKLKYFQDIKSKKTGKQFAAVTCMYDNIACLVFKGTDTSVIAWKENLEMLFEDNIPSQLEAEEYANTVLEKLKNDKNIDTIYLIGHSKGGNIAIYSLLKLKEEDQKRVNKVYAFDSPGFIDEIYNSEEYMSIKGKIVKIVPKDSVIGTLKESRQEFRAVDSSAPTAYQHEILNWNIDGKKNEFVYLETNSNLSKRVAKSVDEWLDTSTMSEKRKFVKAVYNVIKDEEDFAVDSNKEALKKILSIIDNYKKLDENEKSGIITKIKDLITIFFKA